MKRLLLLLTVILTACRHKPEPVAGPTLAMADAFVDLGRILKIAM